MTQAIAPVPRPTVLNRTVTVLARAAGGLSRQVSVVLAERGATALGAAGLASIAYGAGMIYLPAGLIVGGTLAVWFASLLPGGAK